MEINILTISLFVSAYLFGSIPNAVWIGKSLYGIDVRDHGSKNAGTTNTVRVLGWRAGLPVLFLDILNTKVTQFFGYIKIIIFYYFIPNCYENY